MRTGRKIASALIIAGAAETLYAGLASPETAPAGPTDTDLIVEQEIQDETIELPIWAGILTIAVGSGLFMFDSRKR
jgi:hypothetical protein